MTSVMARDVFGPSFLNELQTKVNFDKVNGTEIKKPEPLNSGSEKLIDPSLVKLDKIAADTSILPQSPNLYKQTGDIVSDEGFVKLPRSLWNDPQWKSCRAKYKLVFMTLLFNASYTQKTFNISNNLVSIGPGQFCTSMRNLIDLCNEGIKFKDDKVDKNIIERSVSLFIKIGFVRQEVRHGKSVFTITYPELYEHFQKQSETDSETIPRQHRDINEERKERKEIKETIDGASALDSSLLNNKKEEQKKGPSVFKPQSKPKDVSPEKQKEFNFLWEYIVKNSMSDGHTPNKKKGITEKDLAGWLSKYDIKTILECLKLTLKCVPEKSWPGYMTTILGKNVVAKKDNVQINDEFLKELMKTHKCAHLENTKQYVTDNLKRTDYQKNTDPARFKEMIMRSIEMSNTYDQIEPEYRQESDYEDDY